MKYLLCSAIAFVAVAAYSDARSDPGFSPSFDCAKASNDVEKTICADEELSNLDVALALAYEHAIKRRNETGGDVAALVEDQKQWAKSLQEYKDDEWQLIDLYCKRLSIFVPMERNICFEGRGVHTLEEPDDFWRVYHRSDQAGRFTAWLSIEEKIVGLSTLGPIIKDQQAEIDDFHQNFLDEVKINQETSEADPLTASQYFLALSLSLDFTDGKLANLKQTSEYYSGGAHQVFGVQDILFDYTQAKQINFADLFMEESKSEVKALLSKLMIAQINATNDKKKLENPDASSLELAGAIETINDRAVEDWNRIGLGNEYDDQPVQFFKIHESSYEYVPFAYGELFGEMSLDVKPFLPFIKPEYRDSFIK